MWLVTTEIVVIGTGERFDKPVAKEAIEFLTSKGVVVEQMDTVSGTINSSRLCSYDGLRVGGWCGCRAMRARCSTSSTRRTDEWPGRSSWPARRAGSWKLVLEGWGQNRPDA